MPYSFPSQILCFGDSQLACFGALESVASEQAFIYLERKNQAVFLNLQGNWGGLWCLGFFFLSPTVCPNTLWHPIFEVRPGYAASF